VIPARDFSRDGSGLPALGPPNGSHTVSRSLGLRLRAQHSLRERRASDAEAPLLGTFGRVTVSHDNSARYTQARFTLRVIAGLLAIPIDQRTSGQGRISQ
jgi:hypothetical protein